MGVGLEVEVEVEEEVGVGLKVEVEAEMVEVEVDDLRARARCWSRWRGLLTSSRSTPHLHQLQTRGKPHNVSNVFSPQDVSISSTI